jgi:glycosyltransferase involved in cell wall biosynthesis
MDEPLESVIGDVLDVGVRRLHVLAWRDLDDPDAGGSERHADEFMRRFAAAGLEVTHRTSAAAGQPSVSWRNGYRVVRRGGRYSVFGRTAVSELARHMGPYDALIEILNGVPWFSPLWCRRPRITFLHHVHGPMWDQIMPGPLAGAGRYLESGVVPRVYRRERIVTPSEATREELLELGMPAGHVVAVPNGVEQLFTPGGVRAPFPLVVAVARLAPVKRFDLLIEAAVVARRRVPELRLTIVGDGPERAPLDELVARHDAGEWITFAGRVAHDDLLSTYRRAWLVASASLAEGWGLSLTEGAGCATPAVATNIRGHRSSVVDGVTGLLVEPAELGDAIATVLLDDELRVRLGESAHARARTLTWDASALGIATELRSAALAGGRTGRLW